MYTHTHTLRPLFDAAPPTTQSRALAPHHSHTYLKWSSFISPGLQIMCICAGMPASNLHCTECTSVYVSEATVHSSFSPFFSLSPPTACLCAQQPPEDCQVSSVSTQAESLAQINRRRQPLPLRGRDWSHQLETGNTGPPQRCNNTHTHTRTSRQTCSYLGGLFICSIIH